MRHIKFKYWYLILFAFVLAISTIGSTYAFLTATASSSENAVQAKSTTYSLSMNITPVYSDFSFIPMDNKDALKALENKCKDKYDRGACSAYNIRLYDYNDQLTFISGKMDVTLDNISNLSYMMLEEKNEYNENSCVNINDKTYATVTMNSDGVFFESISSADRIDAKYDLWIKYCKNDELDEVLSNNENTEE